ncbi:unnamed protein product, partial [Amoebophrya sp. A25]
AEGKLVDILAQRESHSRDGLSNPQQPEVADEKDEGVENLRHRVQVLNNEITERIANAKRVLGNSRPSAGMEPGPAALDSTAVSAAATRLSGDGDQGAVLGGAERTILIELIETSREVAVEAEGLEPQLSAAEEAVRKTAADTESTQREADAKRERLAESIAALKMQDDEAQEDLEQVSESLAAAKRKIDEERSALLGISSKLAERKNIFQEEEEVEKQAKDRLAEAETDAKDLGDREKKAEAAVKSLEDLHMMPPRGDADLWQENAEFEQLESEIAAGRVAEQSVFDSLQREAEIQGDVEKEAEVRTQEVEDLENALRGLQTDSLKVADAAKTDATAEETAVEGLHRELRDATNSRNTARGTLDTAREGASESGAAETELAETLENL